MIRQATISDAGRLTEISFAAKGVWGYPEEYFTVWRDELVVTAEYIEKNQLWLWQQQGQISGYVALVHLPDDLLISGVSFDRGFWLDHLFIDPAHMDKGIGRALFMAAVAGCRNKRGSTLRILADPNSLGFYQKMGCIYMEEYPSTIAGRTTPLLVYDLTLEADQA